MCGSCGCAAALPKLETLVLTNNRLSNLVDLDHLAALVNLQNLCLLDNVVTKRPNYRLHLIQKLPKLRLLDFKKVKLKVHPKHQFSSAAWCSCFSSTVHGDVGLVPVKLLGWRE
jgi:hypothetical protein